MCMRNEPNTCEFIPVPDNEPHRVLQHTYLAKVFLKERLDHVKKALKACGGIRQWEIQVRGQHAALSVDNGTEKLGRRPSLLRRSSTLIRPRNRNRSDSASSKVELKIGTVDPAAAGPVIQVAYRRRTRSVQEHDPNTLASMHDSPGAFLEDEALPSGHRSPETTASTTVPILGDGPAVRRAEMATTSEESQVTHCACPNTAPCHTPQTGPSPRDSTADNQTGLEMTESGADLLADASAEHHPSSSFSSVVGSPPTAPSSPEISAGAITGPKQALPEIAVQATEPPQTGHTSKQARFTEHAEPEALPEPSSITSSVAHPNAAHAKALSAPDVSHPPAAPSVKPPTIRQSSSLSLRPGPPASRARPVLNRYHSMPQTMSPLRQHFRLHSPHPHHVKETPSIAFTEDARGRFINQYQIVRVLGRGSFGIVYLAVDGDGQKFALKECSKRRLAKQNRAALMRLRRQLLAQSQESGVEPPRVDMNSLITHEIAIMKKLDHPNLVALYEVLDNPSSESLILVIEWCPGGTIMSLNTPTTATPLPENKCWLYFRDLILGVEYLHSRGVCHRDIKVDNVLLGNNDVVKISDFGVSEIFDLHDDKSDGFVRPVGSPAYMSPELVLLNTGRTDHMSGAPHSLTSTGDSRMSTNVHSLRTTPKRAASASGRRADIWAMGVTLYFMATGHLPFIRDSLEDLHLAILTTDPDYKGISPLLIDLLRRIFEKDPKDRITLREMRNHPWVTQGGLDMLLPEEENVETTGDDAVTEEDLHDAIDVIDHRGHHAPLDYSSVSRYLRASHGWHGQASSSEGSSGVRTPRHGSSDASLDSHSLVASPNSSVKMEKLSLALEEVLRMQENERRDSI